MNSRLVNPHLRITNQPSPSVKYLASCQYNKCVKSLTRPFSEISFDCELNDLNYNIPNIDLYLYVSMVVDDENESNKNMPHPYILKCLDSETRIKSELLLQGLGSKVNNSYLYEINKETMSCNIKDLIILSRNEQELEEYFESTLIKQSSELSNESLETDLQSDSNLSSKLDLIKTKLKSNPMFSIDLDKCKLKLQVIMHDLKSNKLESYLTEPVYTRTILNQVNCVNNSSSKLDKKDDLGSLTNTSILNENNLRILRSSRISGGVNGSDEMIVLSSYINPDDIQVEFFQFKNDTEIGWRSMANLNKTDIHGNCALVFKTPKFPVEKEEKLNLKNNQKSLSKIKVYYRLFRPSTRDYSDKWVFYYCQDGNQEMLHLFGEANVKESRLLKKLSLINGMYSETNSSTKLKRKNLPDKLDSNTEKEETCLGENKKNKIPKLNETSAKIDDDALIDLNKEEEEATKLIDAVINTPGSSVGNEDDDEQANFNRSLTHKLNEPIDLDKIKQKTLLVLPQPKSIGEIFEISQTPTKELSPHELHLKTSLDTCVAKMNALADRTGKALLKFAKTRSFHELLKTQRFLINIQDDEGNTPIHLCIMFGNLDLLELFVDVALTIPYQNIINMKNFKQLSPLLIACHMGELEVCEYLLEANADLTQTDLQGCNPIHIACKNKNINLLKILIKYVDKNCLYGVLNSINHDGYAPIHLAIMGESVDIVRELLYNKSLKINIPDKRAGFTALHHASCSSLLYNICILLVKNEAIDVNARSYNGSTPLHIAVANKNYLISCLLVRNGANLNIQSDIPVHFETDQFQLSSRKNTLLRSCIDAILSEKNRLMKNVHADGVKNDNLVKPIKLEKNSGDKVECLIESTKISEEVKKMYDHELDMVNFDDEPKLRAFQHNFDALFYANNDPWMLEIFKNNKTMSKWLLEKIICFETFRKIYSENQNVVSKSKTSAECINSLVKMTKEKLNYMDKTKLCGLVKISQQETASDELMESD